MKPIPISVQLYSLRAQAAKDFPAVLKQVADIGYVGVEFAGLHGMCPKEVRKIIDDLGLKVSSAHMAMPNAENAAQLIDECKALGIPKLISGFGAKEFETKETTLAAAATAQQAATLLKGSGITLGIHNHWFEFDKKFDGLYPHEVFMAAAPGVFAQIDTYWTAVGGADAVRIVKQYGARAPLLHIKDGPGVRGKAMTAVGGGIMDWRAVIGAAAATTEWLVVELDECDTDMLEAVRQSYKYLTTQGLARGRK